MKQAFLAGIVLSLGSCQTQEQPIDLKISNITVIDIRNDQLIPSQTVLISRDHIVDVLPADEARTNAIQEVDGTGLFLMPGLWDNHVHFGGAEYVDENEQLLPLYLSMGVTSVRDAAGDISMDVLQ